MILTTILLAFSFAFSQTNENQADIAIVEFSGTGISDLEAQTLFNYFTAELQKATDKSFMSAVDVTEKTSVLEINTSNCYSKECLQDALNALGVQQLLAGTIQLSKNKYRVKVKKLDSSKPSKPKTYSIRYKGDVDGFITELEILAWNIMGAQPPGRLLGKRKPSQETTSEKIAANPWSKRIILLSAAGLSGASFVSNMAGYNKSKSRAEEMSDYKIGYDAHMKSANSSKTKAFGSLAVLGIVVGYGIYDGTFSFKEKDD
ncbi:MAG: hypothetical protein ISR89_07700 [Candidatus Marinimicrobia bacterium]|nr:hypothetical protein [Candidatus Neomarinimicrobiota bacterium]MBL7031032.1 hypothetical protein [Candidatus Neomarinimicrobiota bacterium]